MEDLGGGMVKITDDDGSSIVITKEQASLLGAGIEALNEKDLQLLNE
ncbi:MAG: hypothetical protein IKY41_04280 [Clostridia bacterium]|nr:hypothetical protein [Clostridia bacterium]